MDDKSIQENRDCSYVRTSVFPTRGILKSRGSGVFMNIIIGGPITNGRIVFVANTYPTDGAQNTEAVLALDDIKYTATLCAPKAG
jgi:hypothetical protein